MINIGITGHTSFDDPISVKDDIKKAVQEIIKKKGPAIAGYSCMAAGADTLFAEVIEEMGAPLHAILPFDEREYFGQMKYPDERARTGKALANASSVEVTTKKIDATHSDERRQAYLDAGIAVLERCDILIAVLDENRERNKGGAADIEERARLMNKEIIRIHPFPAEHYKHEKSAISEVAKSRYNASWQGALIFLLAAALCLGLTLCIPMDKCRIESFSLMEVLCFFAAIYCIRHVNSKQKKLDRIKNRFEAEALRYMEPLIKAGIPLKPIFSKEEKAHDEEYQLNIDPMVVKIEKRYVGRQISAFSVENAISGIDQLLDSQIRYHTSRLERSQKKYEKLETCVKILSYLFLLGIVLHVVHLCEGVIHIDEHYAPWIHHGGLALTLLVPPLFATVEAVKYFEEVERFIGESLNYKKFLEDQKGKVETTPMNREELIDLAHHIREVLTIENKNWYYLMLFKVKASIA